METRKLYLMIPTREEEKMKWNKINYLNPKIPAKIEWILLWKSNHQGGIRRAIEWYAPNNTSSSSFFWLGMYNQDEGNGNIKSHE